MLLSIEYPEKLQSACSWSICFANIIYYIWLHFVFKISFSMLALHQSD